MLAALWISKNQPYAFPAMFKGMVELKDNDDGKVSLVLTEVKKYTWKNYHGKPVSSEAVLWTDNDNIRYDSLVFVEKELRGVKYQTSDLDQLVTVEFLTTGS